MNIPNFREIFSLDMQTFLDMIPPLLSFIILAVLISYLLYKPVKKILQDRASRVMGDLSDAADQNLAAHELRAKYEQKLRGVEVECAQILSEARRQAANVRDEIVNTAKADAQEVRERAAKDASAEFDRVKGEVHGAIVDISTDIAEKLIAANIDRNVHKKLFDDALLELESAVLQPLKTYS